MAAPIDLGNIQGDILPSLPKKTETFFFFRISNVNDFKSNLVNFIPHITTGTQVQVDRSNIVDHKAKRLPGLVKIQNANISFSREGLAKLGLNQNDGDKLGDAVFDAGMLSDAQSLGDKGSLGADGKTFVPDWDNIFTKQDIDGVIVLAGDCRASVEEELKQVRDIFKVGCEGDSISEAATLIGDVRPGSEDGHEHFGFEDGISNPAIVGVDPPLPGQMPITPGIVLLGRDGDTASTTRPAWALDGTFLTFRKLGQNVPEFDDFLTRNALPINDPSLPADHGKELLGARLVGRWKSGAPTVVAPLKDDTALANDNQRNNNFDFSDDPTALKCPWAAHVRKTNPRFDLLGNAAIPAANRDNALKSHLFLRRGIPYGPEVSDAEKAAKKTRQDRGLLFVCYQSNISQGFQFVQKSWSNSPTFLFNAAPPPGFDPIIGQQNSSTTNRTAAGIIDPTNKDPNNPVNKLDLTAEWVVSHGGAYFFTPSIPALKSRFAAAA